LANDSELASIVAMTERQPHGATAFQYEGVATSDGTKVPDSVRGL